MLYPINKALKWINPGDNVLDVGGGNQIFPRANAVIDLMPYSERRYTEETKAMPELFSKDTWYVGDICSAEVWKDIKDKEFDFVICSHTLEDIRDPLFVCSQLIRIGKAGYIETPSRFRECGKQSAGAPICGYEHHRWIMDVVDGTLAFTMKHPFYHYFDFLGDERRELLYDFHSQFTGVYWKNSFDYVERIQKGSPLETENMFYFYDMYDYKNPQYLYEINNVAYKGKTVEWDYHLPLEGIISIEEVIDRHNQRLKNNPLPAAPVQMPLKKPGLLQRAKHRLLSKI